MSYDPYQAPSALHIPPPLPLGGQVSERAAQELLGTQAWVRFVSVLMLIATGFMFLSLIMALLSPGNSGLEVSGRYRGDAAYQGGYVVGQLVAFFFVGVLYLYPTLLLSKYAAAIRRFRHGRSMTDMEEALRHQRYFWRFAGIVSCVMLVLLVIFIVFAVGMGTFMLNSGRP